MWGLLGIRGRKESTIDVLTTTGRAGPSTRLCVGTSDGSQSPRDRIRLRVRHNMDGPSGNPRRRGNPWSQGCH